jgi:hypothetical protein
VSNKKHSVKKHSVKKHSANSFFTECFIFDTQQGASLPSVFLILDKENLKIAFEAVN